MINTLPNTLWALSVCSFIAIYAIVLGFAWGKISRRFLFRRFADHYTQFDVTCVGIGTLLTLILFEWGVRAPFVFFVFGHVTIGGWWVQIWIVCFAAGTMFGYSKRKREDNNLLNDGAITFCPHPNCPALKGDH